MAAGPKIPYKTWLGFCDDVDYARTHLSWTSLSRRMGKNQGWAEAARRHRGIVSQEDVRDMAKLVKELKKSKKEPRPNPVKESRGTRSEFVHIVDTMRNTYGLAWAEVSRLFGYDSDHGVVSAHSRPNALPRTHKMELGRGSLAALESGMSAGQILGELAKPEVLTAAEKAASGIEKMAGEIPDDAGSIIPEPEKPTGIRPDAVVDAAIEASEAAAARLPELEKDGAFDWTQRVAHKLLEAVVIVEAEAEKVPEMFRKPYAEFASRIMSLAEEIES